MDKIWNILFIIIGILLVFFGLTPVLFGGYASHNDRFVNYIAYVVALIIAGVVLILHETKPPVIIQNYLGCLCSWFGTAFYILFCSLFLPWSANKSWILFLSLGLILVMVVLCLIMACTGRPRPGPLMGHLGGIDGNSVNGTGCGVPSLVPLIVFIAIGVIIVLFAPYNIFFQYQHRSDYNHIHTEEILQLAKSLLFTIYQLVFGVTMVVRFLFAPLVVARYMGFFYTWLGNGLFLLLEVLVLTYASYAGYIASVFMLCWAIFCIINHFIGMCAMPAALIGGGGDTGLVGGQTVAVTTTTTTYHKRSAV